MSQIRLTPEMLRVRAKSYQQEAQKMDEIVRKCNQLITQLHQEWEGKSAIAFQQQFEQLKPNMKKMTQLIETISQQLNQTANAIESLDNEIANKLR